MIVTSVTPLLIDTFASVEVKVMVKVSFNSVTLSSSIIMLTHLLAPFLDPSVKVLWTEETAV